MIRNNTIYGIQKSKSIQMDHCENKIKLFVKIELYNSLICLKQICNRCK